MTDPLIKRRYEPAANQTGTDMRSLIIETAGALGMSPVDLATIISYETAGTFDPMKGGPTTQWGRHRGLIQFGEPQAKQYGVDFSSPEAALASQLGADGAIVKYYQASGWQPGMGMMDAYSVVNAGGPGRYNASDANNGGAPGTVADKVTGQMSGHREKALAMLGGEYAPTISGPAGMPVPAAPQNPLEQPEMTFTDKIKGIFDGSYKPDTDKLSEGIASAFAPQQQQMQPAQFQPRQGYQAPDRISKLYAMLQGIRGS
jgi:hypothetical protein